MYGKADLIENAHFPEEGHDYGESKRKALYPFIAKHFNLDLSRADETKSRSTPTKTSRFSMRNILSQPTPSHRAHCSLCRSSDP